MRKFHFRLQALYDSAQQRERGLRHDLARHQGIEQRIRAQLDALLETAAGWEERIRRNQRGPHDLKTMKEHLGALSMIQRHIARQQQALRTARRAAEKVRAQLTEAARKRKSLERLRERMEEEYLSKCAARQVKLADDMATVRAANGTRNSPYAGNRPEMTGVSQ